MSAALSGRYLFGERVYDATQAEHDKCLGQGRVAVIAADYASEEITVSYYDDETVARMQARLIELDPGNVVTHIVGSDVRA